MFQLFRRMMPREENFFEMFARHAEAIVRGAGELRAMLEGGEAVARHTGRLLLNKVARCLPGELPDEIGEAGVGFAGASNARNGFIRGLGDQPKLRWGGLSLPCHSRADP